QIIRTLWPGHAVAHMIVPGDPGRLTSRDLTAQARRFLLMLHDLHPKAARVTDKLPGNGMWLGLIHALFPEARVVHCRRDPIDTCLSCYCFEFAGALSFAYDLESLGRYHIEMDRLMSHWKAVLPMPIHDAVYEDLVTDLDTGARALVEFAGLPWDDACLRFHEAERTVRTASMDQVRRPIYTSSVRRADRFGARLDPLRRALGLA
ncbi:MAG: sulfotransferase, partial [Phycisphaerales bacterium]|nr:sulfotransferase [Phycisphaerales bacterium]